MPDDRAVGPDRSGRGPQRSKLGPLARVGLRMRHATRLAREVSTYGSQQGLWWLLPLLAVIALFAIAVATTTTAVPVATYVLF